MLNIRKNKKKYLLLLSIFCGVLFPLTITNQLKACNCKSSPNFCLKNKGAFLAELEWEGTYTARTSIYDTENTPVGSKNCGYIVDDECSCTDGSVTYQGFDATKIWGKAQTGDKTKCEFDNSYISKYSQIDYETDGTVDDVSCKLTGTTPR